jgi:hypothetical protein
MLYRRWHKSTFTPYDQVDPMAVSTKSATSRTHVTNILDFF